MKLKLFACFYLDNVHHGYTIHLLCSVVVHELFTTHTGYERQNSGDWYEYHLDCILFVLHCNGDSCGEHDHL